MTQPARSSHQLADPRRAATPETSREERASWTPGAGRPRLASTGDIPIDDGAVKIASGEASADQRRVLSVAEAAALLGVSEWLVLQQIRRGLCPHRRVGRRIVISRARLLAWIEEADGGEATDDAGHPCARPGAARRG